jgi:uncharacterized protein YjbI with pentapeptide repeats
MLGGRRRCAGYRRNVAESWSEAQFGAAVDEARAGTITAVDVWLAAAQLDQLVQHLPRDDSGRPCAELIDLTGAVVEGNCDLRDLVVDGPATFAQTTFEGYVAFDRAAVRGTATFAASSFAASVSFVRTSFSLAWFAGARFFGDAKFSGTSCSKEAMFNGVRFEEHASFEQAELVNASFAGVSFAATSDFSDASFRRAAFNAATFAGPADFGGAAFAELCVFDSTWFETSARFERCHFACTASFEDGVVFEKDVGFSHATFAATASFGEATFDGPATFERARFSDLAVFAGTTFATAANFAGAELAADADFARATFGGGATFRRARFRDTRQLGPLGVAGELSLQLTTFDEVVRIEVSAGSVACDGAVFRAGVDLFARGAIVTAESADFAAASIITSLSTSSEGADGAALREDAGVEPRVTSLRNAKVATLTLSCVDLRGCRLAGAHGLDALRLERVRLLRPPAGRQRVLKGFRWSQRDTIFEEHEWRSAAGHGAAWSVASMSAAGAPADEERLEPTQIASVYRALRKGREDAKDEPGAADFYYGEMEMRRQAADRPQRGTSASSRGARVVVTLYWLVAGYGLRASRALLALVLTIGLLAIPLALWGFRPDRSYGRALLFAAESSISLLRAPEATLTAGGQVVQIVLRLAGPLLFGLAALALRSRVKR